MKNNVIAIDGTARQHDPEAMSEASKDCVVMLKMWMELAEAGEIASLCIIGINKDTSTYRWGISEYQEAQSLMIGALERTKHRLNKMCDSED